MNPIKASYLSAVALVIGSMLLSTPVHASAPAVAHTHLAAAVSPQDTPWIPAR
ncbi:MAG TPA: hypothetical protein VGB75_00055 [Jatrophihabitans sp.]|jgi:hypothetical protein|uniref:hypothetical protein n=1 Tax=Jatrophihabitans sp. TaxID=1932789 RepID=UPI002EEEA34C